MSYIIKPNEFNVPNGSRVVFHDKKRKFMYLTVKIDNPNEPIVIDDELINDDIERFIYKFQTREDGGWKDFTRYSLLVDKKLLAKYWIDEISLDNIQVHNLINYYTKTKDERAYFDLRVTFKKVCEDLWLNHNSTHINIEKYLKYVANTNQEFNLLWKNINLYLEYTFRMKKEFIYLKINRLYYDELINNNALKSKGKLSSFIEREIKKLENNNLQFGYILLGQYYSLLGDRKTASNYFRKVEEFNNDWETHFLIGQGSATYAFIDDNTIKYDGVRFIGEEHNIDAKTTVLVSVDIKYLRYYVVSLLYNSIALKKYHFHIHVIGESVEAVSAITNAQSIYNQILEFSHSTKTSNHPTFSFEETPEFASSTRTYSACARFINANLFMEKFDTNLLILDGDMFIHNNLDSYINNMNKFDVGIAISKGITPFMPWRRFMAGNIYLKKSEKSIYFMNAARDYILKLIHQERSWTLDQNALSFAYENTIKEYPNAKFENIYKYKRPVIHPPIRQLIERN